MALVQPYELLLRWKDGELVGAHKVLMDDGVPRGLAEVIAFDDIPEFFPAPQALADASRLLAENEALKVKLAAMRAAKPTLAAQVDAMEARRQAASQEPEQ